MPIRAEPAAPIDRRWSLDGSLAPLCSGRSVRRKLGESRADLFPRPMHRPRPNQCHGSRDGPPAISRPRMHYTFLLDIRPSSLSSSIALVGSQRRDTDDGGTPTMIQTRNRNPFKYEPEADEYHPKVCQAWFGRRTNLATLLPWLLSVLNAYFNWVLL